MGSDGRGDGWGAGVDSTDVVILDPAVVEWTHHAIAQRAATDFNVRCDNVVRMHGTDQLTRPCNALLAERVSRPWTLVCRKCKHRTVREQDA